MVTPKHFPQIPREMRDRIAAFAERENISYPIAFLRILQRGMRRVGVRKGGAE